MAILPGIPGLELTIEVDDTPLQEYDYAGANLPRTEDRQSQISTTKYLDAPSGTEFFFRLLCKPPYLPYWNVHMDILLDGNYVQAPVMEQSVKDRNEEYICRSTVSTVGNEGFSQNFKFAELNIEEDHQPISEAVKQRLEKMGQITVYLYYVREMHAVSPLEVHPGKHDVETVSEKATIKASGILGTALTHQANLTPPEQGHVTFQKVDAVSNEPFATFIFHYRSKEALKALGVIPRTPQPTPAPEAEDLEAKHPDDMTEEERREALMRAFNRRQEATRVKRERDESAETPAGDDEVEWIRSQPAENIRKRIRRGPREGDEAVHLD